MEDVLRILKQIIEEELITGLGHMTSNAIHILQAACKLTADQFVKYTKEIQSEKYIGTPIRAFCDRLYKLQYEEQCIQKDLENFLSLTGNDRKQTTLLTAINKMGA